MDFEERQEQKRRQLIRVIIAETGMVLAIIAIVVVSLLITMGFWVGRNGQIEQSGLIQIHSLPTGASVTLDGNTLFSRTNLSRSLSAGTHNVKISRDGYDSWEKDLKMYSGLLIRLYYPRLFLTNRTPEAAAELPASLEFYSTSRDRNYILTAATDSAEWQLYDLSGDVPKLTKVNLSTILPGVEQGKFRGVISEISWSNGSDQILAKITYKNTSEWLLINLKKPSTSLNLTDTFGYDFEQIVMSGGGASHLYTLENHQIRRIDTDNKSISRILIDNVERFATYNNNIIYVTAPKPAPAASPEQDTKATSSTIREVGLYKNGDEGTTIINTLPGTSKVFVALSHYYDNHYFAIISDNTLQITYGDFPTYDKNRTDALNFETLVEATDIKLLPSSFSVSPDGEYLVARAGQEYRVIDLDMGDIYSYNPKTSSLNWLDSSMMFALQDGQLAVWDFDYTNYRVLVTNESPDPESADSISVTTHSDLPLTAYPALISGNNRWLYYVVQNDGHLTMRRERIWQ